MRETRPSGSEGGGAEYSIPLFLPLSWNAGGFGAGEVFAQLLF